MGGRKSSSKPVLLPFSETDRKLQDIALEFSGRQLEAFGDARNFSKDLFGAANKGLEGLNFGGLQNDPTSQAALQAEQQRLAGGGISEQELNTINSAAQNQIGILGRDVNEFAANQRQQLIQDVTPGRGLRPTDTPILDRGFQIGSAATKQFAQGAAAIGGQALQAQLDRPLQTSQANQGLLSLQGNLASQDFQNRLNLAGGASQTGLALAPTSDIASVVGQVKAPKSAGQRERSNGGGLFGG